MNIFKIYHPLVNLLYFALVIFFSVTYKHPVFILISFFCSVFYLVLLKIRYVKYVILLMLIIIITYPLSNHQGATIITYFRDDNPLTAESVIYGFATAFSCAGTLCWFLCSTKVMTADKLMCVAGKIHPWFSLVISMIIGFIPRFSNQFKKTLNAHRGMGQRVSIIKKIKRLISVFSITLTWYMENATETSDSMKSRAYGTKKRTSFSPYILKLRDIYMLAAILILCFYIIGVSGTKTMYCTYYPLLQFSLEGIHNFIIYFLFCALPLISEIYGNLKKGNVKKVQNARKKQKARYYQ